MILLYAPAGNDVLGALKQRLTGDVLIRTLEIYTRLDDLFHRLHQPRANLQIGVFAIIDPMDLDRLIAIRELLIDLQLVFALADDDPQTLSKAHSMAPRFITFLDNGIELLSSVVERMVACRCHPLICSEGSIKTNRGFDSHFWHVGQAMIDLHNIDSGLSYVAFRKMSAAHSKNPNKVKG